VNPIIKEIKRQRNASRTKSKQSLLAIERKANGYLKENFGSLFDLQVCKDSLKQGVMAVNCRKSGVYQIVLNQRYYDACEIPNFSKFINYILMHSPFPIWGPDFNTEDFEEAINRRCDWSETLEHIHEYFRDDYRFYSEYSIPSVAYGTRWKKFSQSHDICPLGFCVSEEEKNNYSGTTFENVQEEVQAIEELGLIGSCACPADSLESFCHEILGAVPVFLLLEKFMAEKPVKLTL
jgi:hypothetical protein